MMVGTVDGVISLERAAGDWQVTGRTLKKYVYQRFDAGS
jgi:hypothetical protein